jgi:hypothetical protein
LVAILKGGLRQVRFVAIGQILTYRFNGSFDFAIDSTIQTNVSDRTDGDSEGKLLILFDAENKYAQIVLPGVAAYGVKKSGVFSSTR